MSEPKINLHRYCSACENIVYEAECMLNHKEIERTERQFNRIDQWVTNAELRRSCHMCALLLRTAPRSLIENLVNDRKIETSYKLSLNQGSNLFHQVVTVTIWSESLNRLAQSYVVFCEDGKRKDFKDQIHTMTWSSHTVYQVREWLKSCAESHPQCIGSRSKLDDPNRRPLPSRLLDTGPLLFYREDISAADMDSLTLEVNPYLRLCDTESFPTDTKYLTLSHRWSNPPAVTLNNATAEQFKSSIPLSEMLKPEAATLKQAVHVTRCLGFRYLWIDALCINQEEEQDKQHEISLMGEIYAGSELNLAATAASSGSDGLFHVRNPMGVEPFRKRVRFHGDKDSPLFGKDRKVPGLSVRSDSVNDIESVDEDDFKFSFGSDTADVHHSTNRNPRERMKVEESNDDSQSGIESSQNIKGKHRQSTATSRQPNYRKAKHAIDKSEIPEQGLIDECIDENGGNIHPRLKSDIEALLKAQNKNKYEGLIKRRLERAAQQDLVQRPKKPATIASASASPTPTRSVPAVRPSQLPSISSPSMLERTHGDKRWIRGDIIVYNESFGNQVDMAPLNKRGWVFQERLLAPRVLHFAGDQVYWTCSSLLAAEAMPYGNPVPGDFFFGQEIQRWHLDIPLDQANHRNTWTTLVRNYSMASLTFSQDKLVAISAISRKICKVRNLSSSDYLAGMWRQDLPDRLLWKVDFPWQTKPESLPYIAPSWSWASLVTTGVSCLTQWYWRDLMVADVVDVSVSLKTTDPYGELTSGYIRLRGPLCKLNRRISPLTGAVGLDLLGTYHRRDIIMTYWDYVKLPEDCSSFEDRRRHCRYNITPPQLYLFLISVDEYFERLNGLILQPIDEVKGRYRRLGCFQICGTLDFFSIATLGDDEFVSFEEPNMYVIDII